MERSKYYHSHTDILNFGDDIQKAIDELIVATNDYYIERSNLPMIIPENNFDFNSIKENIALEYFKLGVNLIDAGLYTEIMDILMQETYEIIINNFKNEEKLREIKLQLAYIKKVTALLHDCDYQKYMYIIMQISSCNIDLNGYIAYFEDRQQSFTEFMKKLES